MCSLAVAPSETHRRRVEVCRFWELHRGHENSSHPSASSQPQCPSCCPCRCRRSTLPSLFRRRRDLKPSLCPDEKKKEGRVDFYMTGLEAASHGGPSTHLHAGGGIRIEFTSSHRFCSQLHASSHSLSASLVPPSSLCVCAHQVGAGPWRPPTARSRRAGIHTAHPGAPRPGP